MPQNVIRSRKKALLVKSFCKNFSFSSNTFLIFFCFHIPRTQDRLFYLNFPEKKKKNTHTNRNNYNRLQKKYSDQNHLSQPYFKSSTSPYSHPVSNTEVLPPPPYINLSPMVVYHFSSNFWCFKADTNRIRVQS